mmetsp:Transcript_37739/g.33766  ORF Transcript_37739/g.33766 Transcript_37739/m.33766 type:complete len:220 (+) Transcript_37739:547-1206(+)|eukprot:CAMPEP_0114587456 /NCGR_PEP_ID=MMETSP0125-20121206/10406_1 /TAXON_ID=485358 ORGANISM="Aristerostoma sp., Strain ATCC 50986" /NCGR_SAMPLE_ID=MMETSP0125 /ASSEMBLY_ACC=CAM_ASM_000245 /LENGTH=219 /DNA_ID=CAMNT_0001783365 /DNA_START=545 /DNA_END=1204 /DNA_ORIENTATION=+
MGLMTKSINLSTDKCGSPKKDSQERPRCGCKRSQCLKLYCDCLARGMVCGEDCGCTDCKNNITHFEERNQAISGILEKNPDAFRGVPLSVLTDRSIAENNSCKVESGNKNSKGCHCKKSGCLKKYCECYAAGVKCSDRCCCTNCKNVCAPVRNDENLHKKKKISKEKSQEVDNYNEDSEESHSTCNSYNEEVNTAMTSKYFGNYKEKPINFHQNPLLTN